MGSFNVFLLFCFFPPKMEISAHWVQAQVEHNGAHGEHNGTQEHNSQNAQNTQLWLNTDVLNRKELKKKRKIREWVRCEGV